MTSRSSTKENREWSEWLRLLGWRMRDLRQSLGLTQEELAHRADLCQASVSRFENGRIDGVAALVVLKVIAALARQCRGPSQHLLIEALTSVLTELAGRLGAQPLAISGAVGAAQVESNEHLPIDGWAQGNRAAVLDPQAGVFVRERDCWIIAHQSSVCPLRDCKGLRYIALLLRHPGRKVHALTLLAAAGIGESPLEPTPTGSDSGGRRALAERARVSVTRSIRRALARIAAVQPALGQHLGATIRTGIRCVYEPVLGPAITWEVSESD